MKSPKILRFLLESCDSYSYIIKYIAISEIQNFSLNIWQSPTYCYPRTNTEWESVPCLLISLTELRDSYPCIQLSIITVSVNNIKMWISLTSTTFWAILAISRAIYHPAHYTPHVRNYRIASYVRKLWREIMANRPYSSLVPRPLDETSHIEGKIVANQLRV